MGDGPLPCAGGAAAAPAVAPVAHQPRLDPLRRRPAAHQGEVAPVDGVRRGTGGRGGLPQPQSGRRQPGRSSPCRCDGPPAPRWFATAPVGQQRRQQIGQGRRQKALRPPAKLGRLVRMPHRRSIPPACPRPRGGRPGGGCGSARRRRQRRVADGPLPGPRAPRRAGRPRGAGPDCGMAGRRRECDLRVSGAGPPTTKRPGGASSSARGRPASAGVTTNWRVDMGRRPRSYSSISWPLRTA